jgi:hypothetical protein
MRALDKQKAFKQFLRGWIKGGLIGGVIAALPGLFTFLMSSVGFAFFGAYIGNNESSSMLFWLGLIVGGSTGVLVGTAVVATQLVVDAILQAEESAIQEASNIPLPGRR